MRLIQGRKTYATRLGVEPRLYDYEHGHRKNGL